jgi:putative membrane protein
MGHAPLPKTLLVALVSIGFAGVASAQTTGQATGGAASDVSQPATETGSQAVHSSKSFPMPRSNISHRDREFVEYAARSGMAEVELAKLAEQHASSAEVKQFAERMMSDHGKAGETLREIGERNGITMPAEPKHAERRELGKLAKLSGARFDREYMSHMVRDHQNDVKEFEKERQHATQPDVKSFVEQTLPTLKEHLQMAKQAQAAVGGEKGASTPKNNGTGGR